MASGTNRGYSTLHLVNHSAGFEQGNSDLVGTHLNCQTSSSKTKVFFIIFEMGFHFLYKNWRVFLTLNITKNSDVTLCQ